MNKEENISQDRYDGAMYLVEGILDSLGIGGNQEKFNIDILTYSHG